MVHPKIKLTYFDSEGVAESIRLALVLSKTDFDDVRVTQAQWAAMKPTVPYGTLPVMTIDDGPMRVQSRALLYWVGRNCSETLYSHEKALDIDEAIGIVDDLTHDFLPVWFPFEAAHPKGFFESEEGKKLRKTMREAFVAETLPTYMNFLSDLLEKNDGNWLASKDEPTLADCLAVPFLRILTRGFIDHIPTTCLDSFPKIVDYMRRFCALAPVKGRYNDGIF